MRPTKLSMRLHILTERNMVIFDCYSRLIITGWGSTKQQYWLKCQANSTKASKPTRFPAYYCFFFSFLRLFLFIECEFNSSGNVFFACRQIWMRFSTVNSENRGKKNKNNNNERNRGKKTSMYKYNTHCLKIEKRWKPLKTPVNSLGEWSECMWWTWHGNERAAIGRYFQ